ncbi:MAG: acyl carrier protein [Lachnospiraceae bacterium]|nr:acyl carrier protein [Lachnospiraceae bacterium]
MELEELRNILVKILGVAPDEITMDTSFEEDLGADSLDMYQVVVQMEETFKVKVTPQEIEKIKRVSEAVEYIKSAEKRKRTDSEI